MKPLSGESDQFKIGPLIISPVAILFPNYHYLKKKYFFISTIIFYENKRNIFLWSMMRFLILILSIYQQRNILILRGK